MNQRLYEYIITEKKHHAFRHPVPEEMAQEFSRLALSPEERATRRFEFLCGQENHVFLPQERICFLRTVNNIPDMFTPEEWKELRQTHQGHELWRYSNLCPNYEKVLLFGLMPLREHADSYGRRMIDSLLNLVDRYRKAAEREGLHEIAQALRQVPRWGARSFYEALQSFRILSFALWLEGNYHNTIGRFDQYMKPFFQQDMAAGVLTRETALDLLEEFFLTFNRDSDLYPGVQQGDDGQSMMLGGVTAQGRDGFSLLSELCLLASRNVKLIDPKINVRVSKNTPDEVFTLCSQLTKVGLGFPQYSNDDVVIPGLQKLGYELKDAQNYTVAACWEFIIPYVGEDVPNIRALSFPKIIDSCLRRNLSCCKGMEEFLQAVEREVQASCDALCNEIRELWFVPSPFLTLLMDYPDHQPKYRNFGLHGVGLASAADSLTAIQQYVFQEQSLTPDELLQAVDTDFVNAPQLLHQLRYETPKVGNNQDEADRNLVFLMNAFSKALKGKKNCRGGCWRPGTGSAMYYLWCADQLGASPDGRRKGEPFAANYSVSLFSRPEGPFSVIQSMTKPELSETINGGPLTMEFHSSIFQTEESVEQVGQFVKAFVELGGHQLQINAVNGDTLRDAQKHPEQYPQLIVRVWGWSAYFVELDRAFQDHVIARQEYLL